MEPRMKYSMIVYLMVEHIDGDDFDYWTFDTFEDALEWLKEYPVYTNNWVLSSEPAGLPASEYTKWKEN